MTQEQRDGKACSCASSYKLPRLTKNSDGKRVCSKCYLPRQRQRKEITLGEAEHGESYGIGGDGYAEVMYGE